MDNFLIINISFVLIAQSNYNNNNQNASFSVNLGNTLQKVVVNNVNILVKNAVLLLIAPNAFHLSK